MAKKDPIILLDLDIDELEALSDLMQEKVNNIKKYCRQAKATIKEGVSTPSISNELEKLGAAAVAKRRARLNRINHK
jgi:hypothetical protein